MTRKGFMGSLLALMAAPFVKRPEPLPHADYLGLYHDRLWFSGDARYYWYDSKTGKQTPVGCTCQPGSIIVCDTVLHGMAPK